MNTETTVMDKEHEGGFAGSWWQYPVLRNALIAGMLAGVGFALAHLGVVSERTEALFYFVAIPLGGYHWGEDRKRALLALEGARRLEGRDPEDGAMGPR